MQLSVLSKIWKQDIESNLSLFVLMNLTAQYVHLTLDMRLLLLQQACHVSTLGNTDQQYCVLQDVKSYMQAILTCTIPLICCLTGVCSIRIPLRPLHTCFCKYATRHAFYRIAYSRMRYEASSGCCTADMCAQTGVEGMRLEQSHPTCLLLDIRKCVHAGLVLRQPLQPHSRQLPSSSQAS